MESGGAVKFVPTNIHKKDILPELFLTKSRKTVWDKGSKFLPIVDLKFVELSDFYSSTRGTLGNRKRRIKRSKCCSTSGENK